MAFRWRTDDGPTLNAGMFFQMFWTSIAKKNYSGSAHVKSSFYFFFAQTLTIVPVLTHVLMVHAKISYKTILARVMLAMKIPPSLVVQVRSTNTANQKETTVTTIGSQWHPIHKWDFSFREEFTPEGSEFFPLQTGPFGWGNLYYTLSDFI